MIKHGDIISKLTEAQKLRLVTDFAALGDDELNALGVPRVVTSDLDEINQKFGGSYPSFFGLANSWNKDLFGMIASDLSYHIGGEANLIDTPPMRTKSSVYVDGISEDPFLTETYAKSMCGGIEGAGAAACLTDCSVREIDVGALDKNVNNGVLADFLIKPFLSVGNSGNVTAIKSSPSVQRRNHTGLGEEIEKLLRRSLKSSVNIVFSGASQDTTVATMSVSNELVCNTPLSSLRSALGNYRRLKEEVERGTVSVGELNKAFADGVAISDEMLNAAVDKVIDFALRCYKKRELMWRNEEASDYDAKLEMLNRRLSDEEEKKFGNLKKFRDSMALLSVQESIVMLKNVSAIPVGNAKLAVIGELSEDVPRLDECFKHFCNEKGGEYLGYSRGYSQDEEKNAEAFRAAVKLAQSASTVVMFMGLGKREKSLAHNPSLMLPVNQLALYDAISDLEKNVIVVIRGDFLPDMQFDDYCAGVLFCPIGGAFAAEALCSVIFGKYNPSGRLAVSGYSDVDVYHKTLRDYKVSGKNKVGQFVGYRQYTSNGTSVKYPFGFGLTFSKFEYSSAKLDGNSVTLTVHNTGKYDGREVVQLYVGKNNSALARPLRELKGFVKVSVKAKEKKRITIPFDPADFRVYDPADGSIKLEGGKYTLYIGASCTDIRMTLDYIANGEKIQSTGDKLSDYLQSVSNIVDGGYMLSGGKAKGKSKVMAEAVPDFPYEKLFLDEFGLDVEQEEEYYEQKAVKLRDDDKLAKYIGDGITPRALCDRMVDYFGDRGLAMTAPDARELIAAMVASRMLFVCTDNKLMFADYVNTIGTFFGGTAVVRSAVELSCDEDLFAENALGELIDSSPLHHESVRVAALDDVMPQQLSMFFTPFIRYVANPENNRITYGNYASGEKTVTVAPNIWFAMRVSPQGVGEIPAHLANISTLIMLDMARCESEDGVAEQTGINYYKFKQAFESVEDKFELEESAWKRIDKITSYVNSKAQVTIGNKMWLQMEKLSAAYLAAGGDRDSALDIVVCDKLLQLFVPLLRGKLTRDDGDFAQALDNVFGEDGVHNAKSAANKLGLTVAR